MDPQWDAIRKTLERAVSRVCPRWLADRREDIVQNALVRVMGILDRGEESGIRTASYLWKVAYTATVTEIRRERARREETAEPSMLDRDHPSSSVGPERGAGSREVGRAIADCLREMIEPRRLVVLAYLHGYGLTESSNILGWPRKRVDNLLYRGLAALRSCLGDKGVEP